MTAARVQIDALVLDPLETNTYLLRCDGDCWVVDPGLWPEALLRVCRKESLRPSRILLTHGHGDHIGGAGEIKRAFPEAKLCCPAGDAHMLADSSANLSGMFGVDITAPPAEELLQPGQVLHCGRSAWEVLDTSGHSPGGVSYYGPEACAVFTGDALFAGSIGRVDLPGACASRLLRNIRTHLLRLPPETRVLPGHGPASSIAEECRTNPFFRGPQALG